MKLNVASPPSKGGIKEHFLSKDTNLVSSPPQADGGAVLNPPLEGREAVHHTFFTYPHKPKPNPALSAFFEKLEKVRKQLNKQ